MWIRVHPYKATHFVLNDQTQLERAFRQILSSGPAARRAFNNVVKRQIKCQLTHYCRKEARNFPQFTDSKSVMSFCWNDVVQELGKSLPTLFSALSASMPQKLVDNNGQLKYVFSIVQQPNLHASPHLNLHCYHPSRLQSFFLSWNTFQRGVLGRHDHTTAHF